MMKQRKKRSRREVVATSAAAASSRPDDAPDGQETSCDNPAERDEGHAALLGGMRCDNCAKLVQKYQRAAYREAGYAVMAIHVCRRFDRITRNFIGGSGPIFSHYNAMPPGCLSPNARVTEVEGQKIREIMLILAGPLAEERRFGEDRSSDASLKPNFELAESLASGVFGDAGLPAFFAWQEARVKQILEHPRIWCQVDALARGLLKHDWDKEPSFSGKAARKLCNKVEDAWYEAEGLSKQRRLGLRPRLIGNP